MLGLERTALLPGEVEYANFVFTFRYKLHLLQAERQKEGQEPWKANWLQSYSEPKSFEWHNRAITKILPSACQI
jgi:hypothetical protein